MKKQALLSFITLFCCWFAHGQSNMAITNPMAEQIIKGNYNPASYAPSTVIDDRQSIVSNIISGVSQDSLQSFLVQLETFQTRHSASDTVSPTTGIGAARRWIFSKFAQFGASNEGRLVPSYLTFDQDICSVNQHRNVFAVLPGTDTTEKEILLVEAHFDSRCENNCDTGCYAPGIEDNGSGTALVLELARVMSQFAFERTIVFTTVTGEEQGLYGGRAWANWIADESVPFMACFNNDVVGGIYCGEKSSPPSCPNDEDIDSTHVRIFSYSIFGDSNAASLHKQLARYMTLQQIEEINPQLSTPMEINLRIEEDRQGRGGDHIPFRQRDLTSIRVCAANEHGDGSGTGNDRQHTVTDVLGIDTDTPPNGIIDSFFVDFNYLRRNTILNGVNLGLLAISPPAPTPSYFARPNGIKIVIENLDTVYQNYRVGMRSQGSGSLYFDTVYTFTNTTDLVINQLTTGKDYYFTVMNVEDGVESFFKEEYGTLVTSIQENVTIYPIKLLQNVPNPAKGETTFRVENNGRIKPTGKATIEIRDLLGREVANLNISLEYPINKTVFTNRSNLSGIYTYSLIIDGKIIQSRRMILTQ